MSGVRRLDRVVAVLGLVMLSPIGLIASVAVRATSKGPVFHRAVRVGLGGRPFVLYKFRSMRVLPSGSGPLVTAAGDERVTRVGRLLRRSKIDELPQLLNVVRGEMALVGARPEDPAYVDLDDPEWQELLRHPPGITGAASLEYRDEEAVLAAAVAEGRDLEDAYAEVARIKRALDLDYLRRRTVCTDARLVWRTVLAVLADRAPLRGASTMEGDR